MANRFIFLLLLTVIFLNFPSPVFAAEFTTAYDVKYYIQPTGTVQVESEISLTNRTTNLFAQEYHMTIKGAAVKNVAARDKQGPMKVEVEKLDDETKISAAFNEIVVGKGNTLTFKLSYQSDEIAQKIGRIWEIILPRISSNDNISDYKATLIVDKSLGEPLYFKPPPIKTQERKYSFSYEQLKNNIITAAFGKSQIFSIDLAYHLKNSTKNPAVYQIALPPDTAYQEVSFSSISPQPLFVEMDEDGNWLANYQLNSGERKDIRLIGYVEVFIKPRLSFPTSDISKNTSYLSASQYWPVGNEKISSLAAQLKTPENIYKYVVNNLSYDYTRVTNNTTRLGAQGALENPNKAICMEFTDLTIALLRAAGIPAREINGYAYTNNDKLRPLSLIADVLHAWPEYYSADKGAWIPIDPTWGNTTGGIDYFSNFDLNHITFVIHGKSATYPLPAGSYKLAEDQDSEIKKDVQIDFAEEIPKADFIPLKVDVDLPSMVLPKGEAVLTMVNPNGRAMYNVPLRIEAKGFTVKPSSLELKLIPPWGLEKQKLTLIPQSLFWMLLKDSLLTVEVNGVRSAFEIKSPLSNSTIGLLLAMVIFAIVFPTIFYIVSKRKKRQR